ncbi:MAG: DeoR/GlpR transcriptional regulator [Clostridia bacterium]|nr:DeoR/GlpR transcriptional regulator [Clostridia bacterium]
MISKSKNNERKKEILDILRTVPYVTVEYLSSKLHISASSVRRDLAMLEQMGAVKRSHGGVSLRGSDNMHVPFIMRMKQSEAQKVQIAKKAAALVKDGDTVFIDASSTGMYLSYELVKKKNLTVVTNGVGVLYYLQNFNVRVFCIGGMLDHTDRNAIVGGEAIESISKIRAGFAFFAPQTVDDDGNMFDCYPEEIAVIRKMMECAAKRVCLCDSTKLGKSSTFKQVDMSEIDIFVCDLPQTERFAAKFPHVKFL